MNLLSPLLSSITQLRAKLYTEDIMARLELPIPVVSIGNLTMGGTGKTPFTLWLLENYQHKYKIGVVVRSYKASLKIPMRVEINSTSSEIFGDEAVLIQKKLPKLIVYSGPSKFKTAQKLYEIEKPDLIVIDDGFQHLKLKRNLDIVLLDSSVPLTDYSWLPFGRLREGFSALNRASVIILTKTKIKNEQTYAYLKNQIPESALLLESEQELGQLLFIGGKKSTDNLDIAAIKNKKIFAFAGLARPENFLQSLERLKIPVHKFLGLPDHVNYNLELIKKITEQSAEFDFCITTEKDAVKLQDWPNLATSLFAAPIELQVKGNIEELYEKIDECIRQSH